MFRGGAYTSKLVKIFFRIPLNAIIPSFRMNSGVTVEMATRNNEVREADLNDTFIRNQSLD